MFDPAGIQLYAADAVTSGQFAFSTASHGDFKACFSAVAPVAAAPVAGAPAGKWARGGQPAQGLATSESARSQFPSPLLRVSALPALAAAAAADPQNTRIKLDWKTGIAATVRAPRPAPRGPPRRSSIGLSFCCPAISIGRRSPRRNLKDNLVL